MDQCLVLFFFLSQKHRLHWPTSTCASKTRQELSCALRRMHGVENSSSDGQTNSVTPRRRRDNLALFRTTTALSEESLGFSGLQKLFKNILNSTVENEKCYFGAGGQILLTLFPHSLVKKRVRTFPDCFPAASCDPVPSVNVWLWAKGEREVVA